MKRLVVIAVLVFSMVSVFSQQPEEEKRIIDDLRFGLQVTPTVSWFTTDETAYVDPNGAVMGYAIGIVGDWFFRKNYALSSGLFINSMGGKLTYNKEDMPLETKNDVDVVYPAVLAENGEVTLRPTYLEVPIGIKLLTKDFWRMRFVGQFGVNNYFLMNAKVRCNNVDGADLDKNIVNKEFSKIMLAYHVGVGVEYSLGGDAYLTTSLMGAMGLNDVTKSTLDGIDPVNKLNCVNFKVGIIF